MTKNAGRKQSGMVRINLYITPKQKALLKEEAKQVTGKNVAEMIRRIIDQHFDGKGLK